MSIKKLDLAFLILLGIVPVLWLKQGYLIAKGDYFPVWLNPSKTLGPDSFLWTSNMAGHADPISSFIAFELLWLLLTSLFASIYTQILIQVFFFMGAGLFMYYLTKTVYPELALAPVISGVFYMFNLFALQNRLNDGMAWTYTFLPLMMAMLVRTLKAIDKEDSKEGNRRIVYFSLVSTVALSFASINPSNVVIIFLALAITFVCYSVSQGKLPAHFLRWGTKIVLISGLVNLWWTIPVLNYYLWSPVALNPTVNVIEWSWTHQRASFLNLLGLNGGWSWLPEYVPYIGFYSNPLVLLLTFTPILLASVTLLIRSKKSKSDACLMLAILALLFLAKGLHEPFGQVNLLLYSSIPGMEMFREPQSKFTMTLIPFLSLLIGNSVHHIANTDLCKRKRRIRLTKTVVLGFFVLVFIASAYPMATNPIETKTQQLPFSSYVQIPAYWYDATEWLNRQPGDYRILVTPPNDFYAMPYTWGYYGTDDFLARFIQKPILLTYFSSYKLDNYTAVAVDYLGKAISYNRTTHFQALLDLLHIKYILQRNDIQYDFADRKIVSPSEMQRFLAQLPRIRLKQTFGQIDIYEYADAKPYMYALDHSIIPRTTIEIGEVQTLDRLWDFSNLREFEDWQSNTLLNQFGASQDLTLDNNVLKAELWNSTWGWKTINSPLSPAEYSHSYEISMDVKGQNAHQVHVKTIEFDVNKRILTGTYSAFANDGTFNWTHVVFNFEPTNKTTKYLQVQIWHGHETNKPFPNTVWIDSVKVEGYTTTLNATGLGLIFNNSPENQPATILDYSRPNPTKITARVNATQSFILATSETLDDSWTAYVNGTRYKPISLYMGLKGFSIDQTGLLEVTIEYEPQRWFYYGSLASAATLLAGVMYLTYSYTKDKTILKRIRTTLKRVKSKPEAEAETVTQTPNLKH